ncbi:MAG: peptidylprolyl isomerase, partial [Lachnospiraceae bacterium]|nr:peptidylprolyl isomerase [Lachnospiraceae bacterium]
FGLGVLVVAFDFAGLMLGSYVICGIVEDSSGYHIIKCLNTFNQKETDQNKLLIIEERKKEVFGEEYDVFVETLTRKLNDKVWEEVSMIHDENVMTTSFFDVYEDYFPGS